MSVKTSNSFTNKSNKLAFGIDLGTTNSCISVCATSGQSDVIKLISGKTTMPSCVQWNSDKIGTDEEFTVGAIAYANRGNSNVCYSVKRLMGSNQIITLEDKGKTKSMTPEEVSAEILKGLIKEASTLYKSIKDVVITVPAKFSTAQVDATLHAAKLAGLNVLGISKEPTAAAEAYGLDKKDTTALIYDLGGGTFDTSIVKLNSGTSGESALLSMLSVDSVQQQKSLTVLATRGDTSLGGDDLDKLLLDVVLSRLKAKGVDVNKITKQSLEKLLLRIEDNKKIFRLGASLQLDASAILEDGTKIKELIPLSWTDFCKCTETIFLKTKPFIDDVLRGAVDVKDIVLVGGSTKNKALQEMLKVTYPDKNIHSYLNPDESVALGAGLSAARLKFGDESMVVYDVIANHIGIVLDGLVQPVITQNTTIPVSKSVTVATVQPKQKEIILDVYEGNSRYKEQCEFLGNLVITRTPPEDETERVGVLVSLTIDSNGLLSTRVQVDGKSYDKNLVNILGRSEDKPTNKRLSKEEVRFLRWTEQANLLSPTLKNKALTLINEAKKDPSKIGAVVKFFMENK